MGNPNEEIHIRRKVISFGEIEDMMSGILDKNFFSLSDKSKRILTRCIVGALRKTLEKSG